MWDWQLCLVYYLFIFTHGFIRHKRFHVRHGSERVHTFPYYKHRQRESESVNSYYSEHASRLAKQVILISSKDFFFLSPHPSTLSTSRLLLSHSFFGSPRGGKPNASSRSSPGPRPRLEWWEIQFKRRKEAPRTAPPPPPPRLTPRPHLQGRSWGAKPKPDGLIGPKDNK